MGIEEKPITNQLVPVTWYHNIGNGQQSLPITNNNKGNGH
jgi:hypothetical protein